MKSNRRPFRRHNAPRRRQPTGADVMRYLTAIHENYAGPVVVTSDLDSF